MQSSVTVLLCLCLTLVLPGTTAAQSLGYAYKAIQVPGQGLTLAMGINDRSEIVGGFNGSDNKGHGFLLSRGRFTIIDVPGALSTFARAINNRGQIVGDYVDAGNIVRGFLLTGEEFTLSPPGSVYTIAYGINDAGQIAGVQSSLPSSARKFCEMAFTPGIGTARRFSGMGTRSTRWETTRTGGCGRTMSGISSAVRIPANVPDLERLQKLLPG